MFEHATEGIILTNSDGNILLINPAALRLFNYEKDELIGQPVEVLLPSSIHSRHLAYREEFYHNPSSRSMGHGRDLKAKKKDGSEFPVEVSLSYYRKGDDFFVIAFIVDITLRKTAELELLELNARLENKVEERTMILKEALQQLEKSRVELNEALNKEKELNEIKSRFVSMASHEFRTPLSTILSSAALIGRYNKEEEQVNRDKHTKRIKESVKHLNDLLEDFLSLGKLEEGKVQTKPALFLIKEFIEEVTEEMKPVLKEGQTINVNIKGAETFSTDKRLLKNILLNVIGNAVKFSPVNSEIVLGIVNEEDVLTITIKDQGIGISAEDQQHLFSSFFRAKNAANIQGTGLGLHIVKRYVNLLEGSILLQSAVGEGTTVTLTLKYITSDNE